MTSVQDVQAAVRQRLLTRAQAAATLAGVELRSQLRENTQVDTGKTSRAWFFDPPRVSNAGVEIRIRHPHTGATPNLSPRVVWLSDGTQAHWIPKGGRRGPKILRFEGREGVTFRPVVWHPAYTGTGFIERILSEANVSAVLRRGFSLSP